MEGSKDKEIDELKQKVLSISEAGKTFAKKNSEEKQKIVKEKEDLEIKVKEMEIQYKDLQNKTLKLEQEKGFLEEKLHEDIKKATEDKVISKDTGTIKKNINQKYVDKNKTEREEIIEVNDEEV